jgi:hypothetical protein
MKIDLSAIDRFSLQQESSCIFVSAGTVGQHWAAAWGFHAASDKPDEGPAR